MKNSFCFGGCLNIQCRSVTAGQPAQQWLCSSVSLRFGLKIPALIRGQIQSSKIWLSFFPSFVFNKGFLGFRSIHTAAFYVFFSPGLDQRCCNENFWVQRETPLCVCVCVCTHTHIILKTQLTDTPMRSHLQAEFLTLFFAHKTKSRHLCYRGKRFEYLTHPHPYMLVHTQSQGRKSHCFLSRSIFHPCKNSVIYFLCSWNSRLSGMLMAVSWNQLSLSWCHFHMWLFLFFLPYDLNCTV